MNASVAIARTLGIVLAIMGASVVIDRQNVSAALEKVAQGRGFLWLWSFLILTMGAVIVVMNNIWTSGLPLLVTILGWLTLLKGTLLLFFSGSAILLYRKCNNASVLIPGGIAACVLGLVLIYLGSM